MLKGTFIVLALAALGLAFLALLWLAYVFWGLRDGARHLAQPWREAAWRGTWRVANIRVRWFRAWHRDQRGGRLIVAMGRCTSFEVRLSRSYESVCDYGGRWWMPCPLYAFNFTADERGVWAGLWTGRYWEVVGIDWPVRMNWLADPKLAGRAESA